MKIENYFKEIINNLNQKSNYTLSEDVIKNTAKRMEDLYNDIFSGLNLDPSIYLERKFPVTSNDIVIEKNIQFYSMCEHHLLPFFGKISIGYIPNGYIVGFGDIIKVIEGFCKRPQLQERLIAEIADTIYKGLNAQGVYIIIEAEHTCMTMRGVKSIGSKVISSCSRGVFNEKPELISQFLNLVR